MNSIPIEVSRLGLEAYDYVAIAYSIKKEVLDMLPLLRQRILHWAKHELSDEVTKVASELLLSMGHDREFFEAAGLPYGKDVSSGDCFTVAVAYHLLRNMHRIRV